MEVTAKSLGLKWQTVAFSLPLNDHLEGKSTGVTGVGAGEERAPQLSCLPARRENSIVLPSELSPESALLKSK